MKKFAAFIVSSVFLSIVFISAQTEQTAFNLTGSAGLATATAPDYEAIGINPANLGFDTKYGIALGIAQVGISFYSEALAKPDAKADIASLLFNNTTTISTGDQIAFAESFLSSGVTFNADVMPLGISLRIPHFGTLGLALTANSSYYSVFSGDASSLVFEGYNWADYFDTIVVTPTDTYAVAANPVDLATLTDGTQIKFTTSAKVNLSYGTQLYSGDKLKLYGGIGIKYVMGFAYFDFNSSNDVITGTSALGLNIFNQVNSSITSSEIVHTSTQPVGHGVGFDLGVSAKYGDKLTLGLAVDDIGKVHYTANVLQLNNPVIDTIRFTGVNTTDPVQIIKQLLYDQNIISYSGLSDFDAALPTVLRMGGCYEVNDFLKVGVDAVFPVDQTAGSLANPIIGAGGQVTILKVLELSSGITIGGGYHFNIPGGVVVDLPFWEFGIASRDITTLFGQVSPTVSLVTGFLRFKI